MFRCLKIQTERPAGRVALVLYDADTIDQIAGADFLAGIKRHISRAAKSPAAAQHFVPAITQTKIQRQAVSDLVSDLPQPCCRSEEHTSELQSLMRISYAVFCLKKTK